MRAIRSFDALAAFSAGFNICSMALSSNNVGSGRSATSTGIGRRCFSANDNEKIDYMVLPERDSGATRFRAALLVSLFWRLLDMVLTGFIPAVNYSQTSLMITMGYAGAGGTPNQLGDPPLSTVAKLVSLQEEQFSRLDA
jgi:hypothetical protein